MTTYSSMYVLGVSGSLRKASYNTALLRAAAELMPPGMTLEIFDLAPLPLFNQDAEKPFPEAVAELRTRLAQADALLIATPEYNNSISGALKNAIDWASRPPKQDWPASRWPSWAPAQGTSARESPIASAPGVDARWRPAAGQAGGAGGARRAGFLRRRKIGGCRGARLPARSACRPGQVDATRVPGLSPRDESGIAQSPPAGGSI